MFRGLINDAKSAVGATIAKYLARASVAVPFVVAAGFGTAATTVLLVERFGSFHAYLMLAGGFTLMGLVATLVVSVKEQEEVVAERQAEDGDTASVASDAASQAATQLPIAALGALFTTPGGASAALGGAKLLGRNFPLVVLLVLIGMLFWPGQATESEDEVADTGAPKPNGMHPPAGREFQAVAT